MEEVKKEIKLNESHFKKDYRKILTIPKDADEDKIASMCAAALQYMTDPLILEGANILISPKLRREYDNGRKKLKLRQQAEIDRKNKEADAEIIAEKRRKRAERIAKNLERFLKGKAEKNLNKDKEKINKDTENYIKRSEEEIDNSTENREKVVYIHSDEITANKAKKETKLIFKNLGIVAVVIIIVGNIFYAGLNRDTFKEKINTLFDKDDDKELNYDEALASVGASLDEQTLEEQEISIQANSKARNVEEQYLEETEAIIFTDPSDEEQIKARAIAINKNFNANKYNDTSINEIVNQIKYFNGTYDESSKDSAYDMQDSILNTFTSFASTIAYNDTFISGISTNEGETVGSGFDAYLLDTSPNKEIVREAYEKFKNLLTSKTDQERVDAVNELIILEYELMTGTKQKSTGEYISYADVEASEGVIIGIIAQLGNDNYRSIKGEDNQIKYTNKNGEEVVINYDVVQKYYNPKRDGEIDFENTWVVFCMDLVNNAESRKNTYN